MEVKYLWFTACLGGTALQSANLDRITDVVRLTRFAHLACQNFVD